MKTRLTFKRLSYGNSINALLFGRDTKYTHDNAETFARRLGRFARNAFSFQRVSHSNFEEKGRRKF